MDGAEIRRLRRRAGLTQEALAECIGVEQGTVSRWERGVERPRPRSAIALRDRLLVDYEQSITHRQFALMRNNLVIGGILDAQTRLKETSRLAADFYWKRSRFDIAEDIGKPLEQQLLEKGGDHSWDVVQRSGILTGQALLVRMFVSRKGLSYLTHYEPVFQDGELSGILAYIARSAAKGLDFGAPFIRYAEAIYREDAGKVTVIHQGDGADKVRAWLSDNNLF